MNQFWDSEVLTWIYTKLLCFHFQFGIPICLFWRLYKFWIWESKRSHLDCLRVNVWELLHFSGTLFLTPPFSGLFHWFIIKTWWKTHPTRFLGSKRLIFGPLKFFFEKSWFFSEKTKMDQKWSKNPEKVRNLFQAWFPIIFIIWTHKIQNFGILGHFAPFFVIFSRYPKRANPEVYVSMNLDFLVKIMFYGFKIIFEILWKKKIISKITPENWVEKFAFFDRWNLVIFAP